mmetsp:Transcript_24768/g.54006  ORF Transcript_24768/g.54006 Transcript_24768/m.54006 type:complete len:293 (-) Transcript_24768:158-1036(-)|eukprot:CAMPEP_0178521030 /NCGR_PEP_ID=MMETSP0696-20121128/27729_1 /TAXON_ID=265572 /ORGANISM="Extubocellulus spinifer, Strain CCMP396" /LENGTH=292 /DNA_ID=CAMNT_0020151945 /DNA_START=147 /DNA_END=1025 /DNA_ORIENTATION=-
MVRRIGLVAIVPLLASPAAAQFGIPNRKKGGGSFEEMNEMAKNQAAGGGGAAAGGNPMAGLDLDALKGMDADALSKMMEQAMSDPALKEQMDTMQAGMADAMEQLSNMSPEELQKQMMEGLAQLTSGDIMDTVMGQKDEVLETLAAQGMVPKEKLEEYRNNPELFEKEMKGAFAQMQQVFQDPEMLSGAVDMMKNMQEAMTNPEKAMKELAATMKGALDDDVKIEEARLELIKDPNNAGNPMLAQLFADEEMKEILYDSEKWRAAVKEGQGMLLNDAVLGGAAGAGARVGEL